MRFVAQLYCPADETTENEAAFHRTLYVFACPTCCRSLEESAEKRRDKLSSAVRVLRCQLPKDNDFYPSTGKVKQWNKHTSAHWATVTGNDRLNLCAVTGQCSKGKCPKQKRWFSGPAFQKEYLRASKHVSNGGAINLPSIYHESELVVEEEPEVTKSEGAESPVGSPSALFPNKDITDADADLEQSDLNALTGSTSLAQAATGVTDPNTLAFYARMAIGGEDNDVRDQVLRYSRWAECTSGGEEVEDIEKRGGPLWISSNDLPDSASETEFPPKCEYCGAPRKFEFQLMPQMLHYLLHSGESGEGEQKGLSDTDRAILLEAKAKIESGAELPPGFLEQHDAAIQNARNTLLGGGDRDNESSKGGLDWGTVAVYTCTASCGDGSKVSDELGSYMEERGWVQPPLD